MSDSILKTLLDVALDNSYVEYENDFYFQWAGIQMGGSASVSIANIVASVELHNITTKEEIVFYGRFVDDMLLIVDSTDIDNINLWCDNNIKHDFLNFSVSAHEEEVNFLDLTIMLDKTVITTKMYKKPMSKHKFPHYLSNHPVHIKKSLPYSCGLRVIRNCSHITDRNAEISSMINQFKERGYPANLLTITEEKLKLIDRESLIAENRVVRKTTMNEDDVIIILPFFNNIQNYSKSVIGAFHNVFHNIHDNGIRGILRQMSLKIAYSVSNSIRRLTLQSMK